MDQNRLHSVCRAYLICLLLREKTSGKERTACHDELAKACGFHRDNERLTYILHNLDKEIGYDINKEGTDIATIEREADWLTPKLASTLFNEVRSSKRH